MIQYKVYFDNALVYATGIENSNPEYCCYNVTLNQELNAAGSLELTMPHNHPLYHAYTKLRTTVYLYTDGVMTWKGRVLNDERDIYLNKTVFCEGELAFLNDIVCRPYDFSENPKPLEWYYNWLINKHNDPLPANHPRRLELGTCTVETPGGYEVNPSSEQGDSVLNELTANLLNEFGGFLRIRHQNGKSYIDYIQDFSQGSSQIVHFGVNLLDINESSTAEEVYTVMIPYGKKDQDTGERTTIEPVNGGADWISDDEAVSEYGNIEKIVYFDDIDDPYALLEAAISQFYDDLHASYTITINAIDMHFIDESQPIINVGDYVGIVSLPNEISAYFLCDSISLNLNDPTQNQYSFGSRLSYLTDKEARDAKMAGIALVSTSEFDMRQMTAEEAAELWNQQ